MSDIVTYWRRVVRRALDESSKDVGWTSKARLVGIVLTTFAAALITWFATYRLGDTARAGATLAGSIGVAAILASIKLLTVPAKIDAEQREEIAVLKEQAKLEPPFEPDASLPEAIGYILSGKWTGGCADESIEDVIAALERVHALAGLGRITIFGRLMTDKIPRAIPAEFWAKTGFKGLHGFFSDDQTATELGWLDPETPGWFVNLGVGRLQIERVFPADAGPAKQLGRNS